MTVRLVSLILNAVTGHKVFTKPAYNSSSTDISVVFMNYAHIASSDSALLHIKRKKGIYHYYLCRTKVNTVICKTQGLKLSTSAEMTRQRFSTRQAVIS
jgi:hypothetical protein